MKTKLLLASLIAICSGCESTPSEEGSASPSGDYVAELRLGRTPDVDGNVVWTVTIVDNSGKVVYRDANSEFPAQFGVILAWDADDRLWVYGGDSGRVFFWERAADKWQKCYWGCVLGREISRQVVPPTSIRAKLRTTEQRDLSPVERGLRSMPTVTEE